MKRATIEILHEGQVILGSHTNGKYFVRYYDDELDGEEEMGGGFFQTMEEAESRVLEYQNME